MKVASIHTYAAAPAAVFAALTTADVLVDKYEQLGHSDVRIVDRREHAGAVDVTSRRSVPMDVPSFAKRFLSPSNSVEQHDSWSKADRHGNRTGTFTVAAKGVPVKVTGTLRLAAVAGGTEVEIAADVTSSVPFIGGKLASFVGGDVERTIHGEEDFNDRYLLTR